MATRGFIGIDAGTQGLSVIFTDEQLNVLATGEGSYEMVPGLEDGSYEQNPLDWQAALVAAMKQMRANLPQDSAEIEVLSIGISGQMHGEVLVDEAGEPLGPARLWCDARNESEGRELTGKFQVKMPKRITSARWLWTIRNRKDIAARARRMTTPSGWIAFRLTGQWLLGIGDAAGMFPIDPSTLDYDRTLLESFDDVAEGQAVVSLKELLPGVRRAGEDGGTLDARGAEILGLPAGIPVAPAEGDQPAALAGSLIGSAGMVSCSFGTSVCANSVGDRAFEGVSDAVDHFCAPDGKPINMICLRNGTTFMNCVVGMFGKAIHAGAEEPGSGFAELMPAVVDADADCGGIIALPFMNDEPGLGVSRGGTAMLSGLNDSNASPGNVVKAALLSTMFNLRAGCEELDQRGFPRSELILTGGLTRTPELGQLLADVFRVPVILPDSAEEGTAWGAAVLAKYRALAIEGGQPDWDAYLESLSSSGAVRFEPDEESAATCDRMYERYQRLMTIQKSLEEALSV